MPVRELTQETARSPEDLKAIGSLLSRLGITNDRVFYTDASGICVILNKRASFTVQEMLKAQAAIHASFSDVIVLTFRVA